jgi:hypothetical protein
MTRQMEILEESSDEITPNMGRENTDEGGQSYIIRKFIDLQLFLCCILR